MKAIIILGVAGGIGVAAFGAGLCKSKSEELAPALAPTVTVSQPQLLPPDVYNSPSRAISQGAALNFPTPRSVPSQKGRTVQRKPLPQRHRQDAVTDSYSAQTFNYQPRPRQISYVPAFSNAPQQRSVALPAQHPNLEQALDQVDGRWQPVAQTSYLPNTVQSARPAFNPFGGQTMQRAAAQNDPRQNLLRMFLGDGASPVTSHRNTTSRPYGQDASAVGQAQSLLQQASDQASQAESDAERASSGDDRQGAASSAQYHAGAAREAADTAYSIAYGSSSSEAKNYAAQARDAANRAQAAADRASSNASM